MNFQPEIHCAAVDFQERLLWGGKIQALPERDSRGSSPRNIMGLPHSNEAYPPSSSVQLGSNKYTNSHTCKKFQVSKMLGKPVKLPKFSELPYTKGDPLYSAWGLYGKDDQLGMLNRLTNEIVVAAARDEIRTGVRYRTSNHQRFCCVANGWSCRIAALPSCFVPDPHCAL